MRVSCILLIFSLFCSFGCAHYRHHAFDDLRDTFRMSAGSGLGLHADLKLTSLLHSSLGFLGGIWMNAGFRDRYTPFMFGMGETILFPVDLLAPLWKDPDKRFLPETLKMGSVRCASWFGKDVPLVVGSIFDYQGFMQWQAYGLRKVAKHPAMFKGYSEKIYTEKPFGFECGVGVIIFNIRIGFDPVEFVDLLTTLFVWDILGDNPDTRISENDCIENNQ